MDISALCLYLPTNTDLYVHVQQTKLAPNLFLGAVIILLLSILLDMFVPSYLLPLFATVCVNKYFTTVPTVLVVYSVVVPRSLYTVIGYTPLR